MSRRGTRRVGCCAMMKERYPWSLLAVTLLGGVVLAAVAVHLAWVPLPFMVEMQRNELLRPAGALVWPAVFLPWLLLVPRRHRWWLVWLASPLGFTLQGQPFVFLVDLVPRLNRPLVPWVLLGGLTGLLQVALAGGRGRAPAGAGARWVPPAALVVGAAALAMAWVPVTRAMAVGPGEVAVDDLELVATHTLRGVDADRGLKAFTWEGTTVVMATDKLLWLGPDGRALVRDLPLDPTEVEVRVAPEHFYVVEKAVGRLRCLSRATGEVLWQVTGMGSVDEVAWTGLASPAAGAVPTGWFLDHPDHGEGPEQTEVTLHRVDLRDGSRREFVVHPPAGYSWPEPGGGHMNPWPRLGVTGSSVFLVGVAVPTESDLPGQTAPFVSLPPQVGGGAEAPLPPATLAAGGLVVPDMSVSAGRRTAGVSLVPPSAVLLYISSRAEGFAVTARDLATGEELWTRSLETDFLSGQVLFVLPGRVLVDGAGVGALGLVTATLDGREPRALTAFDPLSGEVLWSWPKEGRLVEWAADAGGGETLVGTTDGLVARLGPDGSPLWTRDLGGPVHVVLLDPPRNRGVFLTSPGRQLPTLGLWGVELTLDLATGEVVSRPENQPGSWNLIALDGRVWRTAGRRTGAFLRNELVLNMGRPAVAVRDLIRGTDSVLGGREVMVAAARAGPDEIVVFVLERR